jgi:hypothetical protein
MQTLDAPREQQQQAKPLFANRVSIHQLPAELNKDKPPCERSVRNLMDKLEVPFIKIAGVRWYDRDDVRDAILATEVNRKPRGRGRPRRVP